MSTQTQRRPFIHPDGTRDPVLYLDSEGFLRDQKGFYLSPDCALDFVSKVDVKRHIEAWHRKGGIYARWINENGKQIDNRPYGQTKNGFGRISCKPRESPKQEKRLTQAEAKQKIPLHAFI